MKKRIGLILSIVIAALVIALLVWRFWPHSFSGFLWDTKNTATGCSAYAMVQYLENGQSHTDTYRIDRPSDSAQVTGDILSILATSDYRQDFRNLLPWDTDSVETDGNYDGRTVTISFYFDNSENQYMEILFLSSSIIVVRTEEATGLRIYHPTNSKTMDSLVAYLQTNGELQ